MTRWIARRIAGWIAGFALLAGCGPLPGGDDTRPDIVLISIDSLRADHLGVYGSRRPTSPAIDALSNRGIRFERARAASPWTLPSHSTMFTGLWPTDHQVIEDDRAIGPTVPYVPQVLQAAGWATAGFVSTIYVSDTYGFGRGFDRFEDYGITERDNLAHPIRADRQVNDAVTWVMESGKNKPVFLFLHIYDVHYPYLPPPPFDTRFDRASSDPLEARYRSYRYYQRRPLSNRRMAHQAAQYDESIAWVDSQLARLFDAWDDSRRPVRFIITADHGEELGERGSWGHGHTLYREALEVPLIVSGAGIDPAVRSERAGTIDIAATVAALAGVPWGLGPGLDLRGPIPERPFLAETSRFDSARVSLLEGGHRLDLDLVAQTREVYAITRDPLEKEPLADAPVADALEQALWRALPEPWTVEAGAVRSTGVLYAAGLQVGPTLTGPARFGVYPPDAGVSLDDAASIRGVAGAPSVGALRWEASGAAAPVMLTDTTRAQLEALGYIQGEEEVEEK